MNYLIAKTCCVTGHRPKGFPWDYRDAKCSIHQQYLEKMTCQIEILIMKGGITHFISGGAIGVDMDFADIVIYLRDRYYPTITLEIAAPCPNQCQKWHEKDKVRYKKILQATNKITYVSNTYNFGCMQKRNKYMVDNSDIVLAFWNGKHEGGTFNTITYTKNKRKQLIVINLCQL